MTLDHSIEVAEMYIGRNMPELDLSNFRELMKIFESDPQCGDTMADHLASFTTYHRKKDTFQELVDILKSYDDNLPVAVAIANAAQLVADGTRNLGPIFATYRSDGFRNLLPKFGQEIMDKLTLDIARLTTWKPDGALNATLVEAYTSEQFVDLMEVLSPQGGAEVAESLLSIIDHNYHQDITDDFLLVLHKNRDNEKTTREVARSTVRVASETKNVEMAKDYITCCNLLPGFESCVYAELSEYIQDPQLVYLLRWENDFLKQQSSETVIPMAVLMTKLHGIYTTELKSLDERTKQHLSQAYSIARNNKDESGKNYLKEFYAGVKGMLDERPEMLGRWAECVCDEFKKQGEAGLLRWTV